MKRLALLLSAGLVLTGTAVGAYALDENPETPAVGPEEPAAEDPAPEQPTPEEPKPEEPKPEEQPTPEEPKPEEPKPEEPTPEEPKPEEPKPEEPKPEEPKPEEPKPEEPKPEEPKPEEPKPEEPKPEEPKPEEPKPEETQVKEPETLVTALENPSGIAIHGGTGHVFVASRYGVYRYDPTNHKIAIEVAGYTPDKYGKGPIYDIGPLGVAFLNDENLIVGDGSRKDGEELVRIYKIAPELPAKFRKEDTADITLGPIPQGDLSASGEGNFYQIAVTEKAFFVTSNGDDTKGWVLKSAIGEDGKPGELTPSIATKEATGVDAPVGITLSPEGELVIGQMGEVNTPGDSLLTFYNAETGELVKKYETGLSDIAGLAYSPKTGKLYAVDFSWAEPAKGGLFRLDIAEDKVTATKVYDLDKPTSLAFDKDGKLYVTVFNTKEDDGNEETEEKSVGTLIVFEAGL